MDDFGKVVDPYNTTLWDHTIIFDEDWNKLEEYYDEEFTGSELMTLGKLTEKYPHSMFLTVITIGGLQGQTYQRGNWRDGQWHLWSVNQGYA